MVKRNNNHITLEDLAQMVKRGFDATVTKGELNDLKGELKGEMNDLKGELNDLREVVKDVVEELNAVHTDVRHIRSTVDKLVHSEIAQDATLLDLTARVHRLERKTGLAK